MFASSVLEVLVVTGGVSPGTPAKRSPHLSMCRPLPHPTLLPCHQKPTRKSLFLVALLVVVPTAVSDLPAQCQCHSPPLPLHPSSSHGRGGAQAMVAPGSRHLLLHAGGADPDPQYQPQGEGLAVAFSEVLKTWILLQQLI